MLSTQKSEQVRDKFSLGSTDFYRFFLQLRDYLLSHKEWDKLRQPPTLESLLIKVTKEGKGGEQFHKSIIACSRLQLEIPLT